jgi:perosamine synthetase
VIPVSEPFLGERELEYVTACLRSGWVSSAGEYIDRFEAGWAEYCGRRRGIAVSNGTVALQLAVAALGLEPGDEVIMPAFTIISCPLAVLYNGGAPVLVDSEPETWCLDVGALESLVSRRTRAIMPVHIYGHPVDMDAVLAVAERHGLAVIEDAAEAQGAEYLTDRNGPKAAWRRCGSMGSASCFSFYANKLVTTGEGGMVLTDDEALADRLASMRNLSFDPQQRFRHLELGYNFRLTNLQAALGVAQLERLDAAVDRKRELAQLYAERLRGVQGLQLPVERPWARSIYWMYGVVLDDQAPLDAAALGLELQKRGIETRPFFLALHEQPALRQCGLFTNDRHPVAERIARRGLYLPSGIGLTDEQVRHVTNAVSEVLG